MARLLRCYHVNAALLEKLAEDQLRQLSREIDAVMDLPESEWRAWMNARKPGDQTINQRLLFSRWP